MRMVKRVCIFCGSSSGILAEYKDAAVSTAQCLVNKGIGVVYGGGSVGLMGAVADAVLAAGGDIIGVIPKALFEKELGHSGLHRLHVVESMHERKALMADIADAFIALPGGFGTFEEFFEILTWSQLGIHRKPVGLLNTRGYYDALIKMCDHAMNEGFLRPEDRSRIISTTDPETLVNLVLTTEVPETTKWLRPAQT